MKKEIYIFDGVSISPSSSDADALRSVERKLSNAGVPKSAYELNVYKKSVDARRKSDVKIIYSVSVLVKDGSEAYKSRFAALGARVNVLEDLKVELGSKKMTERPLVVGMGPAGMFCALILAERGYKPIIIDRGDCIRDRVAAVEGFYKSHVLDGESNIQFGAGGAGTFSDGKLLTRINDPRCAYVLETFKRFGAPDEVTVKAKPHIGTDILRDVVDNMLNHIKELGGDVIYRCKLVDIKPRIDGIVEAVTTKGSFACSAVVLALGHSARDTYGMLIKNNFSIVPKPISVGVRIEHKRSMIEEALYGRFAGMASLGAAEYCINRRNRLAQGLY